MLRCVGTGAGAVRVTMLRRTSRLLATASPEASAEKKHVEKQARSEALFVELQSVKPESQKEKLGVYRWNNLGTSAVVDVGAGVLFVMASSLVMWKLYAARKYEAVYIPHPDSAK
eukprot:TRINITY_DN59626_c0_g1_i1.p2 TRINITY_DN59626_c0_g1~~TRINITY_DN59626_c0_g1_i1.p2  ORF type:complete len:115 (+),score=20.06 TRINITY_DN59626_c0_g1_i1:78-422(+)